MSTFCFVLFCFMSCTLAQDVAVGARVDGWDGSGG